MNKRIVIITACLVLALFGGMEMKKHSQNEQTFGNWDLKYGQAGQDVSELQGRLKFLGFYNGKVDGDFGWQTLQSVKDFQWKFGMKVDGIAGASTKLKLWEATKSWQPSAADTTGSVSAPPVANIPTSNRLGLSEQDLNLMANAVYGESRGEPFEGQIAVAAVILNRIKNPNFPNTVSGVIFQPGAFTAVADGQIWLTPNENAKKAVRQAVNGIDPSNGCIYYFNPATATSKWIWGRPQVITIGKHIFCK
jgi:N-acetylmuramoyl-L-alanine amidase